VTGDTQRLVITRDDINRAYDTIRPYLRRTPVVQLDLAGPATLKLEQLQCAGSFKARGAFTNLLLRDVPPAGVVAASGGNHGVAVAYAAHRLGIPARIFVPTVSSPAKIERIANWRTWWSGATATPTRWRPRSSGPRPQARSACTPTTSGRPYSARPRSPSSSTTRPGRSTRCWSRSAAAASSPGSPPTSRAPPGSSAWSPTARRPSSGPGRPASPSTRRRAASPWSALAPAPRRGAGLPDHPGLRRGRGARGRRRHP